VPEPGSERLDGKVVILSGASRGIGKGLALGLAEAGATVVCAARSTAADPHTVLPGTVEETAEAIRAAGGEALAVRCDIGVEADIVGLVDATVGTYGRADVLINNAMASTRGLWDETTLHMWDESMRINVRSLFLTAKAVEPVMAANGGGSIINISSGAADPARGAGMPPGYMTYSVAKAALERFSVALALELADRNIAVNALRPGAVKTEQSTHELGEDYDWTGWRTPDTVVPAVRFLSAQDASGFTGRIVDVLQFPQEWP
jgi:NAD(P)-dependent dehydrogenase (short-subunit alcohol dehydrogenase family)